MTLVTCPKCNRIGHLRARLTGSSYFPRISTHYPNDFVRYREANPGIPLSTTKEIWDHYYKLIDSHDSAATSKLHGIIVSMGIDTTRIYEFKGQRITDDDILNPYEYSFVCTYDPTGKRLGHIHIHKRMTPFRPKKWVFQVLGPKSTYYYVAHYNSKKYKENVKKYKEGKIKARPNGSERCNLGYRPALR